MTRLALLLAASAAALAAAPALAQDASALAAVAQDAARQNRHADAIAAYRRAMALAPERRGEWLVALADQLTWSQQLPDAIATYRAALTLGGADIGRDAEIAARTGLGRALAWSGEHRAAIVDFDRVLALKPGDRDVGQMRADSLLWSDRLGAAAAGYHAVLQNHPGDEAALLGLARTESWRGHYRAALDALAQLPGDRQRKADSAAIAAETLGWMGRPDRAVAVLDGADPGNDRITKLRDDLALRARPEARFDLRDYNQSDDLKIRETALEITIPIDQGRGQVGARLVSARYTPPRGPIEGITVTRPALQARYRLDDAWEVSGALALDHIRIKGAPGNSKPFTGDLGVTWRPSDVLRFDVGASRGTFDSEDALKIGLVSRNMGASVDVRLDGLTQFSARASRSTLSDGNARTWFQFEASRRLVDSPRVIVSYRYTNFDYRTPGQRGYYNPDGFQSHEAQLRSWGRLGPKLRWDVRLVGGREKERTGPGKWIINTGGALTFEAGKRLEIEAGYDFSTSRTTAVGGFERGIARVTVRKRF